MRRFNDCVLFIEPFIELGRPIQPLMV